jgi:hypothetical protein
MQKKKLLLKKYLKWSFFFNQKLFLTVKTIFSNTISNRLLLIHLMPLGEQLDLVLKCNGLNIYIYSDHLCLRDNFYFYYYFLFLEKKKKKTPKLSGGLPYHMSKVVKSCVLRWQKIIYISYIYEIKIFYLGTKVWIKSLSLILIGVKLGWHIHFYY